MWYGSAYKAALLVLLVQLDLCLCRLVDLGRYKAGLVRIHNYLRAQENATNMEMMVSLVSFYNKM